MSVQRGIARVAASLACVIAAGVACAAPLPALKVDASNVTVSGLSSGGCTARQLRLGWWWRSTSLRESPCGHVVEGRC